MTHPDPYPNGEAEREALTTLIARFSADRDMLAAAVQRAEAAVHELAARLEAGAAHAPDSAAAHDVQALRFELGRLEAVVESLRDEVAQGRGAPGAPREGDTSAGAEALLAAVDEVRTELRRVGEELGEQAARHAERAVAGVAESSAEAHRMLTTALAEARAQLASGLDEAYRIAVGSGERATQALTQTSDLERRWRELEAVRAAFGPLRGEVLRRVEETEARLGVRLDSIVAGVEAETRAVRDGLWDRITTAELRLKAAEAQLAALRLELPQAAAQTLEEVAALHAALDEMRGELAGAGERVGALERQRAARSGLGGVVDCVRDEVVAAVMMVVSFGVVLGRLTLNLVR